MDQGAEVVIPYVLASLLLLAGAALVWLLLITKGEWSAGIGIVTLTHVIFYLLCSGYGAISQRLCNVWCLCGAVILLIIAVQTVGRKRIDLLLLLAIVGMVTLSDLAAIEFVPDQRLLGMRISLGLGWQVLLIVLTVVPGIWLVVTAREAWVWSLIGGAVLHGFWYWRLSNHVTFGLGRLDEIAMSILMMIWVVIFGVAVLCLPVRLLSTFIGKKRKNRLQVQAVVE